jgi:hypothetical protein
MGVLQVMPFACNGSCKEHGVIVDSAIRHLKTQLRAATNEGSADKETGIRL